MISSVWIGELNGPAGEGNADVMVLFDDGRAFGFTAFTPEALRAAMTDEGLPHFVCSDLMVLASITEENVRAAVGEMETMGVLERMGTPQSQDL